jgi:transcriptional regulator with XRE-family HTH domain
MASSGEYDRIAVRTMVIQSVQQSAGGLLRQWREQRRLSQLELSLRAEISTKHLSFVETNRSSPSRELLLHLAEQLDIPLRERNQLLLAGGYAPIYPDAPLDTAGMETVRSAVRQLLVAHEPYPAIVVDRVWNLIDANQSASIFMEGLDLQNIPLPINVLRAGLQPGGLASRILNFGEWRAHLLARLRRQIGFTADPELARLYDELNAYSNDDKTAVTVPASGEVFVPLRMRHGDLELAFLSVIATFGTALDVNVAELSIESFFPADVATNAFLRSR